MDRGPAPLHACERAVGDWLNAFKGTAFTAAVNPANPLGVAFSGGADSTALLLAVKAQWAGPVVVVSSELPEVLGIADRIMVMREGVIAGELSHDEADEVKALNLAMPAR